MNEGNINDKLKKLGINFDFLKSSKPFEKFKEESKAIDEYSNGVTVNHMSLSASTSQKEKSISSVLKPIKGSTPRGGPGRIRSSSSSLVKVCPECAEINSIQDIFCDECGTSLEGVNPVPSRLKNKTSYSGTTSMTSSVANFYRQSGSLEVPDSATTDKVSDSAEFVYDKVPKPIESLPSNVRAELSLNLKSSVDSSVQSSVSLSKGGTPTTLGTKVKSKKKGRKADRKNQLDIAEEITFEYREGESPKKSLSDALKDELALNLRDSQEEKLVDSRHDNVAVKVNNSSDAAARENGGNGAQVEVAFGGQVVGKDHQERVDVQAGGDNNQVGPTQNGAEPENDTSVIDINYQEFLQRLIGDPRFGSGTDNVAVGTIPQPLKSQGRPRSSSGKVSKSGGRLRSSVEPETYQRRWATSTWNSSDFSTKPSTLHGSGGIKGRTRPISAKVTRPVHHSGEGVQLRVRPSSAGSNRSSETCARSVRSRPQSAGFSRALQSLEEEDQDGREQGNASDWHGERESWNTSGSAKGRPASAGHRGRLVATPTSCGALVSVGYSCIQTEL